jgi:hypothetical protein
MQEHVRVRWSGALLVLAACSWGDELHDHEFCPAYAQAECAAVKGACAVPDEQSCRTLREIDCQLETRSRLPRARGFNATGARACIRNMKAVYSKTFIPVVEWRQVAETCLHTYFGHRGAGESCRSDRECEQNYSCQDRACGHKFIAREGPPYCWPQARRPCPNGQACVGTGGDGVCQAKAASGGRCAHHDGCNDDEGCSPDGRCLKRLPIGAPCEVEEECHSPSAFCDPSTLLCATGFAVTPASDFCQPYRRVLPDSGPPPDARVRADAPDARVSVEPPDAPIADPPDAASDQAD